MVGHSGPHVTLGIYTHAIHDPEIHARFLAMPSWLGGATALPAPIQPALPAPESNGAFIAEIECPIQVPEWAERWLRVFLREIWAHGQVNLALRATGKGRSQLRYELQRCGLPTIAELEAAALAAISERQPSEAIEVAPPAVMIEGDDGCPIDVPEIAASWVKPFIRMIDQGMTEEAACQVIRKAPKTVRAELRNLRIAKTVSELQRRLRNKRIMSLYDRGYQNAEIARLAGVHVDTVYDLERELHKERPSKPLKELAKQTSDPGSLARDRHKSQLKKGFFGGFVGTVARYWPQSRRNPQKNGAPFLLSTAPAQHRKTRSQPGLSPPNRGPGGSDTKIAQTLRRKSRSKLSFSSGSRWSVSLSARVFFIPNVRCRVPRGHADRDHDSERDALDSQYPQARATGRLP